VHFAGHDEGMLRHEQDVVEGQGCCEVGADGELSPGFHIHASRSLSMALLVFFSAAAGARIVAPDFRFIAAHGFHDRIVAADARRDGIGPSSLSTGRRRHISLTVSSSMRPFMSWNISKLSRLYSTSGSFWP